jgi:hypothetical protein
MYVRPTEYTQSAWPLSGVHSIMMEKLAQPGVGGGARPPAFTISTITNKVVVYAPAERAGTLPLFLLRFFVPQMALAPFDSMPFHRAQKTPLGYARIQNIMPGAVKS